MPKTEFLMKAHSYAEENVVGWLCSRKLNGYAVMWDGGITRGMLAASVPWYSLGGDYKKSDPFCSTGLWSSHGKVIMAPNWFLDALPRDVPLQGEIWYNDSKTTASVTRTFDRLDPRWDVVHYVIYNSKPYSMWDVNFPKMPKNIFWDNFIWKSRMNNVVTGLREHRELLHRLGTISSTINALDRIYLIPQITITSTNHLRELVKESKRNNHEGLMLINPNSYYEPYRSRNLLKIKPTYDVEVTVIGHTEGHGRHTGRMGALVVEVTWDEKVLSFHGGRKEFIGRKFTFNVGGGFTDVEREWWHASNMWPIGTKIVINFTEIGELGAPPTATYGGLYVE